MKKYAIVLLGCLVSGVIHAETWKVTVTAQYLNSHINIINVPVLEFIIPIGQCIKGKSRTEKIPPKPIKVTQEICVERNGDKTEIKGWIFATERITDLPLKGEFGKGELNYGQALQIVTDGGYIRVMEGRYTITAFRNNSL